MWGPEPLLQAIGTINKSSATVVFLHRNDSSGWARTTLKPGEKWHDRFGERFISFCNRRECKHYELLLTERERQCMRYSFRGGPSDFDLQFDPPPGS
jgi:hypothetical protein